MKAFIACLAFIAAPIICTAQTYIVIHVQRATNGAIGVSIVTPGQEAWWPAGTHTVERACALIREAWRHSGQGNSVEVGIVVKDVKFTDYYPLIKALAESEARQFQLLYVAGMQNGNIPDLIRDELERLSDDNHGRKTSEPQQETAPYGSPAAGSSSDQP